jgi:signal transduction histidine kinase/phage shock protein PspC (stress-responsive transcriptional regulator)
MATAAAPATRRLYRRREGRIVAGVASGLSEHLGIDVRLLRAGFVATVLFGGFGVVLYAAFWAVVRQSSDDPMQPRSDSSRMQLVGFAVLGLCMLLIAQLLGFGPGLLWPAAAAVAGGAILWRQADEPQRLRWRSATARQTRMIAEAPGRHALLRYAAGLLLVAVGMTSFLATHAALPHARRAALPVLVVVLGLALVVGPWMIQTLRQLTDERTARIREHERVELAGRVHDSMLQTLTLIQRRADDPDEVIRLVRRSERELRGWLYTPTVAESLRTAILALAADAEDSYAVTVDVVMVGETTTTPAIDALVQAVRESVVNSAKHSGAAAISVYAEAGAEEITVFVRDRGAGFDPDAIPPDRFGVRESVMARMQRHGGEAEIRSAPGSGTEVRLRLPVHAASEA